MYCHYRYNCGSYFKLCTEGDSMMEATYMRTKKDGRIQIKSGNKGDQVVSWTLIILTVLTVVAFLFFNYAGLELGSAITETANNLKVMFLEPALSHFDLGDAIYQVGITL